MSEYIIGIIMGVLVGAWITAAGYHFGGIDSGVVQKLINECELTIPRDQHCIITAVIEESGE